MDSGVNEVTVQKENKKRNKKFPPPTFKQKKKAPKRVKSFSKKLNSERSLGSVAETSVKHRTGEKGERGGERARGTEREKKRVPASPSPLPPSPSLLSRKKAFIA